MSLTLEDHAAPRSQQLLGNALGLTEAGHQATSGEQLPPAPGELRGAVPDSQELVSRFYWHIVGREPDPVVCAHWAAQVDGGVLSAERLREILRANQEVVSRSYREALAREPDAETLYHWVTQLGCGMLSVDRLRELLRDHKERVVRLYRETLGVDPDPGTAAHWTTQLSCDTLSVDRLEELLRAGKECVSQLYQEILKKEPDPDSLLLWATRLSCGLLSMDQLRSLLGESKEFVAALYRETRGADSAPEVVAHWAVQLSCGWVTADQLRQTFCPNKALVFQDILGREADPEALAHWAAQLSAGRISVEQLRETLCDSPEYRGINQRLRTEIETTYAKFLFREPTAQELAQHVNLFRTRFTNHREAALALQSGNIRKYLGIRPINLEMDVTNQCNLRCIMCEFSDAQYRKRKRQDISVKDFEKIADQLFPLCHNVCLSWETEPLLHRQFGELLMITKKYEIPFVHVNTNAILLNDQLIDQIIESSLDCISISIDGATEKTYERIRAGANFDKLLSNIRAVNRAKERMRSATPYLGFGIVLMQSNIRELPALVQLAHELQIGGINAMHIVPYPNTNTWEESVVHDKGLCNRMFDEARALAERYGIDLNLPDPEEMEEDTTPLIQLGMAHVKDNQDEFAARALAEWYGIDLNLPDPEEMEECTTPLIQISTARVQDNHEGFAARAEAHDPSLEAQHYADSSQPPKSDYQMGSCCPIPWHFVALCSDGRLISCGWMGDDCVMGNIQTESFEQIWNNERYRALRSEHITGALREGCRTCIARTYVARLLQDPRTCR